MVHDEDLLPHKSFNGRLTAYSTFMAWMRTMKCQSIDEVHYDFSKWVAIGLWRNFAFKFRIWISVLTLRRFLWTLYFPLSQLEPSVSVGFVSTFPCDYWRATERPMPFTIPFIPTLARIASTSFHSSHYTNYTPSPSVCISAHYAFLIIVTQARKLTDGYGFIASTWSLWTPLMENAYNIE